MVSEGEFLQDRAILDRSFHHGELLVGELLQSSNQLDMHSTGVLLITLKLQEDRFSSADQVPVREGR